MTDSPPRWLRLLSRSPGIAAQLLRSGVPGRSLLFGPLSLGDDLLCTAVLREARARGKPFTMFTARPELFAGNPDPARVLPIDDYYIEAVRQLGGTVIQPYYVRQDPDRADRDLLPPRHILAEMCRLAGITGPVALRPYLHLTEQERAAGLRHRRQVAIHSTASAAAIPYANKEWGAGRFAEVARLLAGDFKLVQVGSAQDPALPVETDLRGQTSLRETAALLAASVAFVGLEGFLVHLARAVDCPSAVVFGGRAAPSVFGYAANRNFYTAMHCSPCGLRNTCEFGRDCLSQITPMAVVAAVRELASHPPTPLAVEKIDLS